MVFGLWSLVFGLGSWVLGLRQVDQDQRPKTKGLSPKAKTKGLRPKAKVLPPREKIFLTLDGCVPYLSKLRLTPDRGEERICVH